MAPPPYQDCAYKKFKEPQLEQLPTESGLSINTLIEIIKPMVLEKNEFENADLP